MTVDQGTGSDFPLEALWPRTKDRCALAPPRWPRMSWLETVDALDPASARGRQGNAPYHG